MPFFSHNIGKENRITSSPAIELIVNVMDRHMDVPEICKAGCNLLSNLLLEGKKQSKQLNNNINKHTPNIWEQTITELLLEKKEPLR